MSPGGVGTTILIEHLSKFVRVNDAKDADGLKHRPRPPRRLPDRRRILFVHGDAGDVVRSIRRRGWTHHHSAKLGCVLCQLTWGSVQDRLLRRRVEAQIDRFRRLGHGNILLVDYDELWDRKREIAAFFGIADEAFVATFPERRPRTSRVGAAPAPS